MTVEPRSESLAARLIEVALIVVILIFSIYLSFRAGERGFYAFDQSIVFDGGYRVLSGQVPYKDFVIPFGPVAFWLQAIFFKIFGVTYFSYLLGAAALNALATLCGIFIVRLLFPSMRSLSYIAGILTAIWFYPPFGTPWVDQTAFFFSFVAVAALLTGILREAERPASSRVLYAISGCLAFVSFISKQNVALFIAPLYPLLLVGAHLDDQKGILKSVLLFALGAVAGVIAFMLWLLSRSDMGIFFQYGLRLPADLGRERMAVFVANWLGIVRPYFGRRASALVNLVTYGSFVLAGYALIRSLRKYDKMKRLYIREFLASVMCVYCVFFQHLFVHTTFNQAENGLAFIGVIFAVAMGLVFYGSHSRWFTAAGPGEEHRSIRSSPARVAIMAVALILAFFIGLRGVRVAMNREVHDVLHGAEFPSYVDVEGLENLKWGQPTKYGPYAIGEDEVVQIIEYLKQRDQNFFIFPDFTILYGLLNVPSPQPVLWFHDGLTYSSASNSKLDKWVVDGLTRNNVQIFVIEQVSWFNTGERLDGFPQVKSYLMDGFVKIGQIGMFSVYERASALR